MAEFLCKFAQLCTNVAVLRERRPGACHQSKPAEARWELGGWVAGCQNCAAAARRLKAADIRAGIEPADGTWGKWLTACTGRELVLKVPKAQPPPPPPHVGPQTQTHEGRPAATGSGGQPPLKRVRAATKTNESSRRRRCTPSDPLKVSSHESAPYPTIVNITLLTATCPLLAQEVAGSTSNSGAGSAAAAQPPATAQQPSRDAPQVSSHDSAPYYVNPTLLCCNPTDCDTPLAHAGGRCLGRGGGGGDEARGRRGEQARG